MIYDDEQLKKRLNSFYISYNKRKYVHPDPLEFLYNYTDIRDIEIVGLVASSLAYGRVAQILKSVSLVLDVMGSSPRQFINKSTLRSLKKTFKGFRHRFASGDHLAALLFETKKTIAKFGSLNECLLAGYSKKDETVLPALSFFCNRLTGEVNKAGHLVAMPEKGSACKRMNLYLRWMLRKDSVDPGGWKGIPKSKLIIPLDTHMHKIGLVFGLTIRKQADMKTAIEITSGYQKFSPLDPVKFDFALTRLGIRNEMSIDDFFKKDF
ncbi:MAG: TIGR02757 family protein [Desulfobacterales bacterium]|nr:TIGR02757 family protein [Desulfobacterales bacterium]